MDDRRIENDHPPYWAGGPRSYRPLRRIGAGRVLAGVAGGLADYLEVDVTVVRIGFVVLTLLGGIAIPAYLACWLLIPEQGTEATLVDDVLYRVGDFFEEAESRLQGRAR
jgi:phage shock protein C